MKREICKTFCESITVNDIAGGLGISSNAFSVHGDPAGIYAMGPDADGMWVLDDGGWILPIVISSGFDISSPARMSALVEILSSVDMTLDEDSLEIRSHRICSEDVPRAAISMFLAISRVADLAHWTQERVRSTFKEDVRLRLSASLPDGVMMELDAVPDERVRDIRADIVLRSPNYPPVAIYLVQNDSAMFEAMLLKSETKALSGRPRVAAILEKENSGSSKVRVSAVNRLDAWAVFSGEQEMAIERVMAEVQAPRIH